LIVTDVVFLVVSFGLEVTWKLLGWFAVYDWVLSQIEEFIEPHLKKGSPYRKWLMIHDLFEHSGITSFKTTEIPKKTVVNYLTLKQ
jgi:hypothetical protein